MHPIEIYTHPLIREGGARYLLRLILAEAGECGMPGHEIAVLDDIAVLLGFYEPLPRPQIAYLAGPFIQWRTSTKQPFLDRVHEIERLATKQRALMAFGAGPPDHMVGTAEIVIACGNLLEDFTPSAYQEVFRWASIDALAIIHRTSRKQQLDDPSKKGWRLVADDEVLKPDGRLHSAYQEMATNIRREAIAKIKDDEQNPRNYLKPLAQQLVAREIKHHAATEALIDAYQKGAGENEEAREFIAQDMLPTLKHTLRNNLTVLRKMYPDLLKDFTEQVAKAKEDIIKEKEATDGQAGEISPQAATEAGEDCQPARTAGGHR